MHDTTASFAVEGAPRPKRPASVVRSSNAAVCTRYLERVVGCSSAVSTTCSAPSRVAARHGEIVVLLGCAAPRSSLAVASSLVVWCVFGGAAVART